MGLSDYFASPDMSDQEKKAMEIQMLLGTLGGIGQAAQPSRVPANPMSVLGSGAMGAMQGYGGGIANAFNMSKIAQGNKLAKFREKLYAEMQAELEELKKARGISESPLERGRKQLMPFRSAAPSFPTQYWR